MLLVWGLWGVGVGGGCWGGWGVGRLGGRVWGLGFLGFLVVFLFPYVFFRAGEGWVSYRSFGSIGSHGVLVGFPRRLWDVIGFYRGFG